MQMEQVPKRFIGLDIHKKYFVAVGVDVKLNQVFGPQEAPMTSLEKWAKKNLTPEDAIVLEMTTNTYIVYDTLKPLVASVTVVHPPHVALVVRAQERQKVRWPVLGGVTAAAHATGVPVLEVEQAGERGVEKRQPVLHPRHAPPLGKRLVKRILRRSRAELLAIAGSEPFDAVLVEQRFGRRHQREGVRVLGRALIRGVKPAEAVDFVTEKIEPQR